MLGVVCNSRRGVFVVDWFFIDDLVSSGYESFFFDLGDSWGGGLFVWGGFWGVGLAV